MMFDFTPAQRKLLVETMFSLLYAKKGVLSDTDPLVSIAINAAGDCLTETDVYNLRMLLVQYLSLPLPLDMREGFQEIMTILDAAP